MVDGVTDLDRFLYDVHGYLVIPGVLTATEVTVLNAHLDRIDPDHIADAEQRDAAMSWLFDLHPEFARLMDHDRVMPFLREFVDDELRIDGAYALVRLPGEGIDLHARPQSPRDGTGWYHVHRGRITSGLTGVEWALTDMPPGAGGFRCIPGTHKANFDVPFDDVDQYAVEIPVRAGDVVVFTEALTHGSVWRGPGSRRVLIYKYCPGSVAWLSDVWDDAARANLTERQRRMTRPPFVYDYSRNEKRRPV